MVQVFLQTASRMDVEFVCLFFRFYAVLKANVAILWRSISLLALHGRLADLSVTSADYTNMLW